MPDRGDPHRRVPAPSGFRPPWWPEGEPWPTRGPGAWRSGPAGGWPGMRTFFLRRVVFLLLTLFVVVFGASALAVALFVGANGHRGSIPGAFAGGLVLLALAGFVLARAVRRMAAPIGDVMEAADRLAAGDHAARVEPRGPREVRALARAFNAMAER